MSTAPARMATAAVYEAPNTLFVLKQFPLRPVRHGEVLVRVSMSTICRSDIHSYEGRRPNPCPGILGHEIIGVIEEIGEDIERDMRGEPLNIGDRITWSEYFFDGQCYYREVHDMPQKCQGIRKYGHDLAAADPHFLGGFAEYCYILPGTWILKLPPDLSDEEGTPLNCGVATMASVTEAAEIGLGDAVVIQGLGLLGLYGAAMAKARGARCVIGLDAVRDRLKIAKKFGVDHAIDISCSGAQSVVAQVRTLCSPDGADAVIEVCGAPDVVPLADAAHRRALRTRRSGQSRSSRRSSMPSLRSKIWMRLSRRRQSVQCSVPRLFHDWRDRNAVTEAQLQSARPLYRWPMDRASRRSIICFDQSVQHGEDRGRSIGRRSGRR